MGPVDVVSALIQVDDLLDGPSVAKCMVCGKNLEKLDRVRRDIHVNKCLDEQEAKAEHDKKQKKWESTYDCPMCNEPLGPGPVSLWGSRL